jgi:hypothetical protein
VGHRWTEAAEGQGSEAEAADKKKSTHAAAAAMAGQVPLKDAAGGMKNR